MFSQQFNAALLAGLPKGVTYFDTYGFMHQVVANPGRVWLHRRDRSVLSRRDCLQQSRPVSLLG